VSEALLVLGTYFVLTALSAVGYLLRPDRSQFLLTDRILWSALVEELLLMLAFVP
jgi:hypothetical protein